MWTLPAPTESTQSGEKSLPLEILYGVQDIQQNIQQNPVNLGVFGYRESLHPAARLIDEFHRTKRTQSKLVMQCVRAFVCEPSAFSTIRRFARLFAL